MPYVHFTDDQKLRANSVDLAEFLKRQGEKLIPSGRDKRLASDHSITVCGNEWFDHATEEGGGAISFVQNFYNLSYPEAVTRLLGGEQGVVYEQAKKEKQEEEPKEFALPPANTTMRRVYAYLMKQRLISRTILNAFTRKNLIYESCEESKDKTKVYHNAVFVGYDEHGVARHAQRKGLHSHGVKYRMNVPGCNPRHSFHWNGTSDRLYVFEAPIDMLAFITLHSQSWWTHSYVALCCTAEHAMLWMLEQNPTLQKIFICTDHDEAGIEAVGRLAEILRNEGYSQSAPLLPEYKDWDEDLKAAHGLPAEPAEEHPQFVAAVPICLRIGELCGSLKPENLDQKLPGLLQEYKNYLHWGRTDQAMECMEQAAALSLAASQQQARHLGTELTAMQMADALRRRILPHQNKGTIKNRNRQLEIQLQSVLALGNRSGVRSEAEKKELGKSWLDYSISCAKVLVKYEADRMKQQQKEEASQRVAGMEMQ